ncbi:MAG: dihydrofolate reductase family protein [Candidatus Electryonea clarkiae]|nr:dihydrofolate reductase family protein [Candidatus Electryonea clarkiae]MDP8287933.1 dihydrofolate reductase family protein [Candidatus Electryonea clarkiae]
MSNIVYIATSLDSYIADRDGKLEWLNAVPNPEKSDFGYADFMDGIDALVMGRITFETVCGFDIEWPYSKPVFVLSRTLRSIPDGYGDKAEIISGSLQTVLTTLHEQSFNNLYIDGGKTIQSFLAEDLIDELIITRIPILLGGGTPLFGKLPNHLEFEHLNTEIFNNSMVQDHYRRKVHAINS